MVVEMIRLIPNWKKSWKFASIQINVLGALAMIADFAGQTWNSLPPHIHDKIPNSSTIALFLFLLGIVGRLGKIKEKEQDE